MSASLFEEHPNINESRTEDRDDDDRDSNEERTVTGFDSSAALVLVPEMEDELDADVDADERANVLGGSPNSTHSPFDISTDSDEDNDEEEDDPAYSSDSSPSPVPPMSSLTVFLYLLSPFLKLGALLLPSLFYCPPLSVSDPDQASKRLPRHLTALAIVGFAALTAFTRQIWYMLARYVRRMDLEEIVLETFARARGRAEKRRRILRALVRAGTAGMRIVSGVVYVRGNDDFSSAHEQE